METNHNNDCANESKKSVVSAEIQSARIGITLVLLFIASALYAQNPLVRDQFTADPSARVFNNRVYVYPSHDIPCTETKGRIGWFCMEDYHVFSSDNLVDWVDHGMIVTQNNVPWARPENYAMWAPDCIEKGGKYYFYFPTMPKDTANIKGFTIGVAVADNPAGPFVPEPNPIAKVRGIDPNVFIDKDGQAYLYWSAGHIYGAKLKPNMLELDGDPAILGELPSKGLKEGPWVFERNGIYYMTYPHVENKTERLEYAIGKNPLGPFEIKGAIMDEWESGCWTNHHSLVEFKNQWYLFYHHNDLSPAFDKNRSIRADSLFFEKDGKIRKVIPTLRGVGIIPASKELQIDRYSAISDKGASVSFLDTTQVGLGWKTTLSTAGSWIGFNRVSFDSKFKTLEARVRSNNGGVIEVRLANAKRTVVAEITVGKQADWTNVSSKLKNLPKGVEDLVVTLKSGSDVEIDWITFK